MQRHDIAILGASESGTGAAILGRRLGLGVWVSERSKIKDKYREALIAHQIPFEEGQHTEEIIMKSGTIIKSPGIPDDSPIILSAGKKGIPVISEIEFASKHTKGKLICITGSNGKTTTTLLTHHIFQAAGLDACLAGNVGKSFAWALAEKDHEYFILELSSFQLDGMFDARAHAGILLNITPDHLDRYQHDFNRYADSKFRIACNQDHDDHFIYCHDDPEIVKRLGQKKIMAKQYPFTLENKLPGEGAFTDGKNLIIHIHQKEFIMTLEELALQGRHNLYNTMAAGITAKLFDIRNDVVKQSMSDFQNVPHRLEFVVSIHGVEYINDSKATNVNSTWYALESMNKKVIWIAGGQDKGNDYSLLEPLVRKKVRAIICLGKDNKKIKEFFADMVESVVETRSADDAVKAAYHMARRGEAVLLSPACASFDLFENFEDRGDQFKEAVKGL